MWRMKSAKKRSAPEDTHLSKSKRLASGHEAIETSESKRDGLICDWFELLGQKHVLSAVVWGSGRKDVHIIASLLRMTCKTFGLIISQMKVVLWPGQQELINVLLTADLYPLQNSIRVERGLGTSFAVLLAAIEYTRQNKKVCIVTLASQMTVYHANLRKIHRLTTKSSNISLVQCNKGRPPDEMEKNEILLLSDFRSAPSPRLLEFFCNEFFDVLLLDGPATIPSAVRNMAALYPETQLKFCWVSSTIKKPSLKLPVIEEFCVPTQVQLHISPTSFCCRNVGKKGGYCKGVMKNMMRANTLECPEIMSSLKPVLLNQMNKKILVVFENIQDPISEIFFRYLLKHEFGQQHDDRFKLFNYPGIGNRLTEGIMEEFNRPDSRSCLMLAPWLLLGAGFSISATALIVFQPFGNHPHIHHGMSLQKPETLFKPLNTQKPTELKPALVQKLELSPEYFVPSTSLTSSQLAKLISLVRRPTTLGTMKTTVQVLVYSTNPALAITLAGVKAKLSSAELERLNKKFAAKIEKETPIRPSPLGLRKFKDRLLVQQEINEIKERNRITKKLKKAKDIETIQKHLANMKLWNEKYTSILNSIDFSAQYGRIEQYAALNAIQRENAFYVRAENYPESECERHNTNAHILRIEADANGFYGTQLQELACKKLEFFVEREAPALLDLASFKLDDFTFTITL